ncbi:MAG: DNA primase [Parcubacteria group bacterium]
MRELMEDNVSKIKDRVDVVDLIGGYLRLKKAGVNFKAPCPFHNEKSASFFVSPERQIWHCFGCNLGGDIFEFVKQIEGVEFPEALRTLAGRAGIELSYIPREHRDQKAKLYEINELATKFFEKQLEGSNAGAQASKYLKDRGITEDSIKRFRLGYAPDVWDGLSTFLARKYENKEIEDAGLLIKKDNGTGVFDRFRSRIMFPIADANGQVVGFTGRVFGRLAKKEDVGKYVNTPQTAIYDKSRILYGLDKARLDIRRSNRCIVVEGNTDVIMSHQVGVNNVVASSGTALTDGHLRIIKRYTDTLDLCFDTDDAGDAAGERGVGLALAHGFNVNMLTIDDPNFKDPADYIKQHNFGWEEYAKKVKPFLEFYFEKMKNKFDIATAHGKKLFTKNILPMVAAIASKVEQAHWVGETAQILRVKEDVISEELANTKPISEFIPMTKDKESDESPIEKPEQERFDMLEESLLGLIMRLPSLRTTINSEYQAFLSPQFIRILRRIDPKDAGNGKNMINQLTSGDEDENNGKLSIEFAYLKSQELWAEFEDKKLEIECNKLLNYIKRRNILSQLEGLEYDIRSAERGKDQERIDILLIEFSKLSKEIGQIR